LLLAEGVVYAVRISDGGVRGASALAGCGGAGHGGAVSAFSVTSRGFGSGGVDAV